MKPYYYAAENIAQRKWATIEEAQAEAERYAEAHPGRSFEILRCVGYASTSKANTFWMDGEQPTEKPRYRELREGETFQDGDEYAFNDGWFRVPQQSFGLTLSGDFLVTSHRRPL